MASPQRLSALEAAFLLLESASVRFVVGSVLRLEGRIDLDGLRHYIDAVLDQLPRYRQRIVRLPLLHHPVWVDDQDFAIERHVLPAELPPGAADQLTPLERLAGQLLGQGVPMNHPPWRLYLVDDPARGRCAIVALVHHSLVDGVAGVRLIEHLLRSAPDESVPARHPHRPTPAPAPAALLRDELRYRAGGLSAFGRQLPRMSRRLGPALAGLLAQGMRSAPDTGLNPRHTSAERAVAGCAVPLARLRAIQDALGASLNDVVIAATAGAVARTLARRGGPVGPHGVRAMVPVSTHRAGDESVSGNRVALLLVPLPVDEPDPVQRLARVTAATQALKHGPTAAAGEYLVRLTDVTTPAVLSGVLRLSLWRRAFNLIVTNVPGPPMPLYLMGARLEGMIPIVNLWPGQGLGIALLSYDGTLYWGFDADHRVVPDLAALVADVEDELAELGRAAAARGGS